MKVLLSLVVFALLSSCTSLQLGASEDLVVPGTHIPAGKVAKAEPYSGQILGYEGFDSALVFAERFQRDPHNWHPFAVSGGHVLTDGSFTIWPSDPPDQLAAELGYGIGACGKLVHAHQLPKLYTYLGSPEAPTAVTGGYYGYGSEGGVNAKASLVFVPESRDFQCSDEAEFAGFLIRSNYDLRLRAGWNVFTIYESLDWESMVRARYLRTGQSYIPIYWQGAVYSD